MTDSCPTCGQAVRVVVDDRGGYPAAVHYEPADREAVLREVRERIEHAIGDSACECDPGYSTFRCLVCRVRAALSPKEDNRA